MTRLPPWVAQLLAGLRVVLVLTLTVGLLYPLVMLGVTQLVSNRTANGSLVTVDGQVVGSDLIGQSFTDADGNPIRRYFQSRPSAAGDGYDPTSTAASNLGPESVVDVLPDPETPDGKPSLLTQVCARSKAVGELEGVDGARPFCTPDGVGAVLGVFRVGGLTGRATRVVSLNQACPATPFVDTFEGVTVECATAGEDYSSALVVPVRGDAPATTGGAGRRGHRERWWPGPAHLARLRRSAGATRRRRTRPARGPGHGARGGEHHRPRTRVPRRARGERADPQPRARPGVLAHVRLAASAAHPRRGRGSARSARRLHGPGARLRPALRDRAPDLPDLRRRPRPPSRTGASTCSPCWPSRR